MESVFIIAILFFLAVQPFPVAIGIQAKQNRLKTVLFILIMALVQTALFWVGIRLGGLFMHFMDGFRGVVLFLGFTLVGIRMLMEVFHIRKGERTYSIDKMLPVFFASLAQAMNTLLVGLMLSDFTNTGLPVYKILFFASVIIASTGVMMSPTKLNLSFASLLYLAGGLAMLISAVYLAFFIA